MKSARRPGKYLSGSGWIRGAVRVALEDDDIAARIADAAPDTGHGGQRPGAGRPTKKLSAPQETNEEADDRI